MTPRTARARMLALAHIEAAQASLYAAAQASSPLRGWLAEWQAIGDHADATKALWHRINEAPAPTGHDLDTTTTTP